VEIKQIHKYIFLGVSKMDRRTFLSAGAALSLSSSLPTSVMAQSSRSFDPQPGRWRWFKSTTQVDLASAAGGAKVWIPFPMVETRFQQVADHSIQVSSGTAEYALDPASGVGMLAVSFVESNAKPGVTFSTTVRTQARTTQWDKPSAVRASAALFKRYTESTELAPTDGIVLQKANEATKGAKTEIDKVRGIYDWTIANTYRNLDVRGCGTGDVKTALESGDFGGKCADINAVFVALCRASGIPARHIYGVRVGPSQFGYKELGQGTNFTRGQHCRTEVFLEGYGWVGMDPADVTKVQRSEIKEWIRTTNHEVIAPVYRGLFGGWEGNWMGYNIGDNVTLKGARGPKLNFLMYLQGETDDGRMDPYDPDNFKYSITSQEV
jgi:transglutaminase-like putative cysteine protease